MSLFSVKTTDGQEIVLDSERVAGSGSEKTGFFSAAGDQVALFYHRGLPDREVRLQRLSLILGQFNLTAGKGQEKWRDRFCWPTAIIADNSGLSPDFSRRYQLNEDILGLVVPAYPSHFTFYDIHGNLRNKEGHWFTGYKSRRQVPVEEQGTLAGYLYCALSLAQALACMHLAGLAHSDLSTKNVLIDPTSGTSYVTDVDSLVVPGMAPPVVEGSPRYMAPELVSGSASPTIRTDLHALAVLIYETLLHRHPLYGSKIHAEDAADDEGLLMGKGALFVEHPDDNSNRLIPPPLLSYRTLGPHLTPLVKKAFVDGLHQPMARPAALQWETAILRTIDLLHPTVEPGSWVLVPPDWPDLAPRARLIPRPIPYARFFRRHPEGNYVPEPAPGHFCVIYHGLRLARRHFFHNTGVDAAPLSAELGYFARDGDRWMFVNEHLEPVLIGGTKPLHNGEGTLITSGLRILMSSAPTARMLVFDFF